MKNNVVKIYYDKFETSTYSDVTVNIVCHTDGDPENSYWVWEVSWSDLSEYFAYEPDTLTDIRNRNMKLGDAERFVNDDELLTDSDYYECGKEPIYGCWYAPLTMEQINQIYGLREETT